MPITSHPLEYGARLSYILCYELQNNFDYNLFPLSHIFSLSDKDMYFFYILSQCQFQHDHDYKYHCWILFINGISQLFSFVTQTFPRRNPWRRRQSPSQRGRKCEPWKMSVLPWFFFNLSLEEKFLIFPQNLGIGSHLVLMWTPSSSQLHFRFTCAIIIF